MTKDVTEWRTMIPETQEVSLRNAPAHCLERISRPWHREKKMEAESAGLPKWSWWSWESGETNAGGDHRSEQWRGESGTQNKDPGDLRRSPSNTAHVWETTWDQGGTTWKDYRKPCLVLTQLQEFYLFCWTSLEKLVNSRMNRVVSKVLPPRQEIISPSPRAPLDAPNNSWDARAQKDLWKTFNIWKLNHTDLNNPWIKEVMKRESTEHFELKENENLKTSRHFRKLTSWF